MFVMFHKFFIFERRLLKHLHNEFYSQIRKIDMFQNIVQVLSTEYLLKMFFSYWLKLLKQKKKHA